MRDENDRNRIVAVRDRAAFAREALLLVKTHGFTGTMTMEFAAGTGDNPEDREKLFASAVADMAFISETLA